MLCYSYAPVSSDPRNVGAVVILSADESSYVGKLVCFLYILILSFFSDTGTRKNQGLPHPTAWYQEHGAGSSGTAGRSFYTSLGHKNETWQVSNKETACGLVFNLLIFIKPR